jgi:hypothetical protein
MAGWMLCAMAAVTPVHAQDCGPVNRSARQAVELLKSGAGGVQPACVAQALQKLAAPGT